MRKDSQPLHTRRTPLLRSMRASRSPRIGPARATPAARDGTEQSRPDGQDPRDVIPRVDAVALLAGMKEKPAERRPDTVKHEAMAWLRVGQGDVSIRSCPSPVEEPEDMKTKDKDYRHGQHHTSQPQRPANAG